MFRYREEFIGQIIFQAYKFNKYIFIEKQRKETQV